ncbi:hypothetical protein SAMN05216483_6525 [Streptomyces sp. 2131.1]|nr:hypothetical protein SAMN05216483_6525 [Streptomyces sp. 2131.1]
MRMPSVLLSNTPMPPVAVSGLRSVGTCRGRVTAPATDAVTGGGRGRFQQGRMWKTGVQDAVPLPLATWDQRSLPSLL